MSIRVDFSDVKDNFSPVPEGNYDATVFEVEQRNSQAGNPYLNWQLKIQGGEYDGRRLFYMTSLSPKALWKLKQVLSNLGWSKEDLEGNFDLEISDLVGLECTAVVTHEVYEGQTRDRVQDLLAAGNASTGETDLYR